MAEEQEKKRAREQTAKTRCHPSFLSRITVNTILSSRLCTLVFIVCLLVVLACCVCDCCFRLTANRDCHSVLAVVDAAASHEANQQRLPTLSQAAVHRLRGSVILHSQCESSEGEWEVSEGERERAAQECRRSQWEWSGEAEAAGVPRASATMASLHFHHNNASHTGTHRTE